MSTMNVCGVNPMKSKVTLTVDGTDYVPVRLVELKRLRAVEKAARETVNATGGAPHRPATMQRWLRKLAQAVRQ